MPTKVKELMTKDPVIVPASTTLQEAGRKMKSLECGVLPVGSWDKPEGIITDRDIVIRAVADGVDVTSAEVRDYMTSEVYYCQEDDTLENAAQ
ncbi:MAG: CBS domain-containing protein, partial [Alphaproteobacteria bacterium]|nr:CBS domain-containing protein [Alphaproteobacteria bacterium]